MLKQRRLNTFSGLEDVQDCYVAWFDTEKGILHHVSSKRKNALSISSTDNGYCRLNTSTCLGKQFVVYVHRIVCEFFHGAPTLDRPNVNHKNHNTSDNRASNLEWCSQKENTIGDPIWLATHSLRGRKINLTLDGTTTSYVSCTEAANALGYVDHSVISHRIKPLLEGAVDSVTFFNRKKGKDVTVTLA